MDRHMCHQNGPPPPWECAWQPYLPFLVRDGGGWESEGGESFCDFVESDVLLVHSLHLLCMVL